MKIVVGNAELGDGDIVPNLRGKIVEVWNPQSFKGKEGQDSVVQNVFMQIEGVGRLKLAFFNKPPIGKDMIGKTIILESQENKSGTLVGLKLTKDTYKGKTGWCLKINGSALIKWEEVKPEEVLPPVSDGTRTETPSDGGNSGQESPFSQRLRELSPKYREALEEAYRITKTMGIQSEMVTKDIATVLFLKLRDEGLV